MQLERYINNFTQLGNKHSCQKNYVKLHKPFLKIIKFQEDIKYRLTSLFFLQLCFTESILPCKIFVLVKYSKEKPKFKPVSNAEF